MRKLASIQKVVDVQPIEGADSIEVATVLGWHCVIKKGDLKAGEMCCYMEVDSLLPPIPEFEFMAKNGIKKSYIDGKEYAGYRLRTIRLRGQISQGLAMPLSILKGKKFSTDKRENPIYELAEGDDVSDMLGIVKYEPLLPAMLSGEAKGAFPANIPKTDETRIQAVPNILNKYNKIQFYVTEKLDGGSCTIFLKDGELNVCSRNLNLKESNDNTMWKLAKELNLKEKLEKAGKNMALQGEVVGSGINGNKLKMNGHKIYFFSIYDIDKGIYLGFNEFNDMCKSLGVKTVPILEYKYTLPNTVDELVKFATRKSVMNKEIWAEGIVLRPLEEMHDEDLGRLSFKCINPEYLISNGE